MAQKGNKRKQAPTYSADTMALRFMAGLVLIALGVMIFIAVDLRMTGTVFDGLRTICFGLCGSMGYLLPVLLLWAGGLVIWSTQKQASVKPWVFACLGFWGLCTFIMLISGNAMATLGNGWNAVIGQAYRNCSLTGTGGGALGVVLGWPLWSFSPVLAILVFLLGTVFCFLMMVNMTPGRIRALLTGQKEQWDAKRQRERMQADEQQLAWQQQQMEQQAAWQQMMNQQAMQPQYSKVQPAPNTPPAVQQNGWPVVGNSSGVAQWQEQMTAAQPVPAGHQSRIFKIPEEKGQKPARNRVSNIFRKKEEEYDGLVENPGEQVTEALKQQKEEAASVSGTVRRTATDRPITAPGTRWNITGEESEEEPAGRSVSQQGSRLSKRSSEEIRNNYRRPENQTKRPDNPEEEELLIRPRKEPQQSGRTAPPRAEAQASLPEARPVAVPKVQQTIGEETFVPEVHLPPSTKEPNASREEEWIPVPYHYPPITDLALPKPVTEDTGAEDAMRSRKLEETLASFKVQARVVNVTHGPAISRFEMELASGTKVNKVSELEKDIAYGMEATSIRIEAPIPGKSLVGVEVPNRKVATVTLREVLASEKMQNSKSLLTVALGKDLTGTPIVCDLAKMPHMLIAGQTGSGKSVCINAIINSLLYRASPDEVKLILVDPKVVELQCYNGIPHLLIPVVNDPHKAAAALAWAVAEMMERYDKFAERKVRNLDGYNASLKPTEKPMSRIVIIIDELADLMMVCKKDVEEYICRLTQLARAAGIHLIVATQRPSVDVITGLIKANIPSRIAFKTASYVDSRTILDRNGSEQLLGWGDMLYLPTGAFSPTRVQGCFLSDDEVNRVVTHVREANPSTYDPDILEKLEEIAGGNAGESAGADLIGGSGDMGGGDGNLFEQAVEFAIQDGQISTSTLQRRLKIGYARAGRLTDEMEERGIVAAKDGSKPRKCLITREEWEEMKNSTEGMA